MKEHGGVSSNKTAGIKETPGNTAHTELRSTESSVYEHIQDCLLSPSRKQKARRKANRHQGCKSLIEESEYEKCKRAVVYLNDIFKVEKESKNGISTEFFKVKNLVKMKPGGSRSPKRLSPVRSNANTQNAKDSVVVRTTYIKPGSKESLLEGKTLIDGKSNSYTLLDDLSERESRVTDSPKQKKKSPIKGGAVMKIDTPVLEQSKTQKKRSPTLHGDNAVLATDEEEAKKKNIDTGYGDSAANIDCSDSNINKGTVGIENIGTTKKRGRKPKSADLAPAKGRHKKSPGSNAESDSNTEVLDSSLSQLKDGKKTPKGPRSRKKKEECENPLGITKQNDKSIEKETLSVKVRSRGSSESPSPVRRKRSPKKSMEENESPKSRKAGSIQKSKKAKVLNENDDNNALESQSVKSTVDEVIDAVVNENIAMLNKSSSSKSPSRKNKQDSNGKKLTSPSKDKKQTPKEKKSVKNNSQEKEACSLEKKKPRSRSNSASPKKDKNKLDSKLGMNGDDTFPNRKLDFDDDITKLIIERSKLPFPSDFQYKYTSSRIKPGLLGLDDLISKVNNSVKERDDNLTVIFGKAEEPDYYSDDKSPSPMDSDINVSTDSDKTIIEFGDLPENPNEITDIGLKDNLTESSTEESKDVNLHESKGVAKAAKFEAEVIPKQREDEKEISSVESVCKVENEDGKGIRKDFVKGKCGSSEVADDSDFQSNKAQKDSESSDKISSENNDQSTVNGSEENCVETVSIFEMFGLTLKRPLSKDVVELDNDESSTEESNFEKESTEMKMEKACEDKLENTEEEDDDVMFVSETKPDSSIVILSDDDEKESNCIDRTGYVSLKESANGRVKPKFTTVNNVVEPKPLDVLHKLEKAEPKKENAFACNELDEYLHLNKENIGPLRNSPGRHNKNIFTDKKLNVKEELKKAEPDFDEIDGHIFVSFASDYALKAHVSLEKKIDWITEAQLKKMAHLKQMKERQHDLGSRRITDVKSGDEHKQNFRGIPMRLMKYQKLLKQELEDILLGRQLRSPEKSPSKTPTKTTDITKIKGWKSKFQNAEELQEATGLNISESGKVHWKTEERLVKSLHPEEIKDIGLDLKKKRRKLVNYTGKKKSGHGGKTEERDSELMEYEYEIDELAIIESDVYNEDEDKPLPEKIPYNVKYSSQHKYGVRKLFVKRMKLDAEDERILQKLGTQKHMGQKQEVPNLPMKRKKGKQVFHLSKLTHTMAVAAVSAFDKSLLNRAIGMEKAENSRKKKKAKKEGKTSKIEVVHNNNEDVKEDTDEDEEHHDKPDDAETEYVKDDIAGEDEMDQEDNDSEPEDVMKSRRNSSASRSSIDLRKSSSKEDISFQDERKVEIKTENPDTCTEPGPIITGSCTQSKDCCLGCRYGCICHLCKLSDSGEEKEPDFKPPCDKEYCRLGCICDSIDTKSADTHHCRKPGCMFECKCPPKQPKPDIPRERDRSKKKKGRGAKKKKRSPEIKDFEGSGKEEDALLGDDNEWEPPSKKKRGSGNSRFANLPKRETTYRLAKNLDAVSRKAMEVYASSEMFTEQRVRRRRSDQGYEDGCFMTLEPKESQERSKSSLRLEEKSQPRLNEMTGLLEISDEDSEDGEVYPEDLVSCARILPYNGPYKQKRDISQLNKRKGGPSKSKRPVKTVIDLVDSDKEDNSGDTKDRSDRPSTSSESRPQSVTEKMGLTNKISKDEKTYQMSTKWKTQMVCLKAKKKSDDKSQDSEAEIKLLEIMSNCNWEIDRTNMLSKISHIISKGSVGLSSASQFIPWGAYLLEFLPKAEKPAVIPPELKSKLPNEMFSIRIKVTKNVCKEEKVDKTSKETVVTENMEADTQSKDLTSEEKKRCNMKLQKKLIEKIKFAERLRNLIIAEEQKGVTTSKFSVSREGIEKALKKYKTQLWKAYTGTNNFTIQQLKQALHAAKSTGAPSTSDGIYASVPAVSTAMSDVMSSATAARIQANQGVKVMTSSTQLAGHNSFINLASLKTSVSAVKTVGNLVIHSALPASGFSSNEGTVGQHGLIENIENVKNFDSAQMASVTETSKNSVIPSKPFQVSSANLGTRMSSEVVFMPLDKSIHPSQLPPGAKIAVVQSGPHRDGSPVSFSIGQQPLGSGQYRINPVVVPNPSQISGLTLAKPVLNPSVTSSASTRPLQSQGLKGANVSAVTCLSGSQVAPQHQGPGSAVQTSGSIGMVNGTAPSLRAGFPHPQCGAVNTVPNSESLSVSTGSAQPLKNISNFGSEYTATSASTAISPSIYPIRFASNTSSKTHAPVLPNEMIGLPMVASLPVRFVQNNNKVFLIPMTSSVTSSSSSTSVAASSKVSLQVVSQVGTPLHRQGPNSPVINAVSIQDTTTTTSDNHIPTINSIVERENTEVINKEQTLNEENDFQNFELDISEKGIAQGKKLKIVTGKKKGSNSQNSENCDSFHIDSDDNCDIDSLASSTRSLSSLSDVMKTDINAIELKLDLSTDKIEEEISYKENVKMNKKIESDEVHDILELEKSAGMEIENAIGEKDEPDAEKSCSDPGASIKKLEKKENAPQNDSKPDSDCVVLDDTDEDCIVSDRQELDEKNDRENEVKEYIDKNKSQTSLNLKRKWSSDLLDSIDCDHDIAKIPENLEEDSQVKEDSNGYAFQAERDTIRIEESEESDVDVTSFEALESLAYIVPGISWPSQQGTVKNKRKSQHRTIADDDDFQITKKLKKEVGNDAKQSLNISPQTSSLKNNRERFRRFELRKLFVQIERIVFKYNSKMQRYRGKVPKHMIIEEALNLVAALKRREEELKESLDDGSQYKETLEAQLKQQIDSFVKSGVPAPIIKNFLKGVEKSLYPVAAKQKKKVSQFSSAELIKITDSEDSDTALEYDALTPAKVQENWTKLVDSHLCSLKADSIIGATSTTSTSLNPVSVNITGKAPNVKLVNCKHQDLQTTSCASSSIKKEAVTIDSGENTETEQDVSDSSKSQESKTIKVTTEQDVKTSSPVISETRIGCAISPSNVVTPGQKSSSDDDEVQSSTGDALMDLDNDFTQNELWVEMERGEALFHKEKTV